MHNMKDARVFVESLNFDQRRALACALLMYGNGSDGDQRNIALASRLSDAILLARTIAHIGAWKDG